MTGFAPTALTEHRFLGGRLTVRQPVRGYRSGVDAVYLAAAAPAMPGESVLDLGTGAGVAALCLGARVPGLRLFGLEIDPRFAELARSNGSDAGFRFEVHTGDVGDPPPQLRATQVDGVIANPPYFRAAHYLVSEAKGNAQWEELPLGVWIDCALRRLVPGGWFAMIQRTERLADILAALDGRAGDVRIKPIAGRAGREASRVIVTARKGARGPLVLAAPLIEHSGDVHRSDGNDFSPEAEAILRGGAPLP